MLPFWGARDPSAGRSVYYHHTAANAINDFISHIPDGEGRYAEAVRLFATTLYEAAAQGKPFFLDKTPRYHLMLPLLRAVFPDAKFILLTRNPLAVLASIGDTFYHGRFLWTDYWIDWLRGHQALAKMMGEAGANIRVLRYETLVADPAGELQSVCAWLGLPYLETMVSEYRAVPAQGRMGDPKGIKQYIGVSTSSLNKWQVFFSSNYRRRVARGMLCRLGGETLDRLGYPLAQLEAALDNIPPTRGFDFPGRYDFLVNLLAQAGDYRYLQARFRAWRHGDDYAYGYYRHP
jgi:hypothetical protein